MTDPALQRTVEVNRQAITRLLTHRSTHPAVPSRGPDVFLARVKVARTPFVKAGKAFATLGPAAVALGACEALS